LVVGDAAGQVDPINGAGIENAVICGKIAGEVSSEAIENEDTTETFLKKYEELWKLTLAKNFESSLNYRKIFDKLTDEYFNILAEFLEDKNIESISMISILKFLSKYPHLITLLINVFILRK
jgi:digeranylgeranylglycerophospholipid reductase